MDEREREWVGRRARFARQHQLSAALSETFVRTEALD